MYEDPLNPTPEEQDREATKLPVWAQDLLHDVRRRGNEAVRARDLALGRTKPEESGMVLRKRVYSEGPGRSVEIGLGEAPEIVVKAGWGSTFHIQNGVDGALKITAHGDTGVGVLHVQHHASNHLTIRNVRFAKED